MHNNQILTQTDLRRFTGDLERFRHPFVRSVIYTPGVKYIANVARRIGLSTKWPSRSREESLIEPRLLEMHFGSERIFSSTNEPTTVCTQNRSVYMIAVLIDVLCSGPQALCSIYCGSIVVWPTGPE